MSGNELDIKTLETWLWEAACKIRGEIDVLFAFIFQKEQDGAVLPCRQPALESI